ncbi:reverse transcriptase protein [Danaus plexippus plexippus]|uniref:Reverse transcriptase protein n=1 Tax=Danaus plexippus plexippus TaxID=278856 RepID=A0A212FPB4_DANPL|nr:reverse transcriptase protein [Danaus plexippus plexippus]
MTFVASDLLNCQVLDFAALPHSSTDLQIAMEQNKNILGHPDLSRESGSMANPVEAYIDAAPNMTRRRWSEEGLLLLARTEAQLTKEEGKFTNVNLVAKLPQLHRTLETMSATECEIQEVGANHPRGKYTTGAGPLLEEGFANQPDSGRAATGRDTGKP